jgi:hypothetical protein
MHKMKFAKPLLIASAAVLATSALAQGAAPPANHDAPSNPAVDTSSTDKAATPASGSNSFTEKQAQTRLAKHGYSHVSDLKKDDSGVWRGKAVSHGKPVSVALDYKGNITAE